VLRGFNVADSAVNPCLRKRRCVPAVENRRALPAKRRTATARGGRQSSGRQGGWKVHPRCPRPTTRRAQAPEKSGRVEMWRGDRRRDRNRFRRLRPAVPQLTSHDSVSASRSSNRTGPIKALGQETHAFAHGSPRKTTTASPRAAAMARHSLRLGTDAVHVSGSFAELIGFPQSPVPPRLLRRSRTEAPALRRHYWLHRYSEPLRHSTAPGLSLAGARSSLRLRGEASRVAMTFPLCTCHHHCPGGHPGLRSAQIPGHGSLPHVLGGSAPR
jgi:hypothetical protein